MLDQRLLRENPELISQQLARRGVEVDLASLQAIALQERDCEQRRSELQAEGNRIGRQVGQLIQAGSAPGGPEVRALRDQGNAIKHQVAGLEEQEICRLLRGAALEESQAIAPREASLLAS